MTDIKPIFTFNNLSEAQLRVLKDSKIALVKTTWNNEYTKVMLNSAKKTLLTNHCTEDNLHSYSVPGALELPYFCSKLFNKVSYDAIICFGTIIRGDTYHFEVVANESARALMNLSLSASKPIINGVLTCNNKNQAEARAFTEQMDKGSEFALSLLSLLVETKKIEDNNVFF